MKEQWKQIPGYPGYEVSDQGRVRSVDRYVETSNGQRRFYRGQMLRPGRMNEQGHVSVALGKRNSVCVHVAVLTAFKGPCPPGCEGLHGDGDGSNNRLTNLRWGTRSENNRDITRAGKRRLTLEQVSEARRRSRAGETCAALAREFGTCKSNMSYILRGVYYGAG